MNQLFRRSVCFALALALLPIASLASSTRAVTDAYGKTVQVPLRAQRIVALSEPDLDALLALHIVPLGATRGRGQNDFPSYLARDKAQELRNIAKVGNFASPVLELVLQLQPDLILAGGIADPELLTQLSKIAPVFVSFQAGEAWQQGLQRTAQALGQTEQAQQHIKNYQQQVQQLRQRLGTHAHAKVSVVRWNPQGPAFMQAHSFASLVLQDLQLSRPAAQMQPGSAHSQPLSLEALHMIDGDWLFIGTLGGQASAQQALATARNTPAFARLQAVKAGQVVSVDGSLWTGPGGLLAARALLADVEKAMRQQ